jgi:hypothetical protein
MQKNYIMENLNKLRGAKAPLDRLVVCHDMTKDERQECKRLVELAKKQTTEEGSGEWSFKVRGPPGQMAIVRMPVRK